MFYYLASPYSHPDKSVMEARFHETKRALAWLLSKRHWVYSPIVHAHQMAQDHQMPTDAKFWEDYNHAMIRSSCGVWVLCIDGFEDSKGVTEELAYAHGLGVSHKFVMPIGSNYVIVDAATLEALKDFMRELGKR